MLKKLENDVEIMKS